MDGGGPPEKARGSGRQQSLSESLSRSIRWSIEELGGAASWGVDDAFAARSASSRSGGFVDNDEEALRWAAIERLPTYDRLRVSILRSVVSEPGEAVEQAKRRYEHREVDVTKLGAAERQEFIERVFKVADVDNGRFLRKLRNRIDKVGIKLPTVEVRFKNLTVQAKCYLGNRALPTLANTVRNMAESILGLVGIRLAKLAAYTILNDLFGVIRPSRMTLLLGPPSSGKTTLLLALAGKLAPSLKASGEITYNGCRLDEFVPRKTAAYISQNDVHTSEMTVKETFDFSVRCQGVGGRYELLTELARREKDAGIFPDPEVDLFMKATAMEGMENNLQTDYTLKILGLDICADTIIGNEMRRGISGGERKRVTTGEMIVGPMRTLFMDEISTGLDSSTTYQIVKCLQQVVHLGEATILMSLLQPAPETYDLFDDIILLSEGRIVYQGPRDHVLEFFEACGFRCPDRKGAADFLQEVTSKKDQEQYWAEKSKPYCYISASGFAERFKKFHVGQRLEMELDMPFDKSNGHKAALVFSKNVIPTADLLRANFAKEFLLLRRHAFVYIVKTVQIVLVAFVASTVFLRTRMHVRDENDGFNFIGALLYGMIVNLFNSFPEIPLTIARLPVFYKQRDLHFYPAWAFTLPNTLLRIPISVVSSVAWVIVTYYTIGFAPEASRFFKQMLLTILVQQMAAGMFKFIAATCRSMTIANTGGMVTLLVTFVLGGFLLPRGLIPSWWVWGYWSSPLTYAYNAFAVNELLAPRWMDKLAPDGRKLGVAVLEDMGIFPENKWYWIGVAALLGYAVLFNLLYTLALSILNPLGKPQAVLPEAADGGGDDSEKPSSTDLNKEANDRELGLMHNGSGWNRNGLTEAAISGTMKTGMVLPFTPLAMSFDEVNYCVDMPAEMREQGVTEDRLQLLRGITAAFRPGVLTALMGVSGAGKTTLLDVLAGRKTGGYIEGDIRISGYPKNQATFARVSGYCEQNDIHSPQVTVRESLIFSAFLRLPKEVGDAEKMRFVKEVMELVELENLKDAIVGLPGITGLSTEQRKRLTIAVELVSNPSIIFMDEPTSGLDARAAAIVMRAVRNTVNTGRTVVCTIHQPSIDIFEAFDELLLLKRGGQVIYSGPLGHNSHKMIEYFESIPGVSKIKDNYNPATWMLEVSSVASEVRLGIDFAEHYKSSPLFQRNKAAIIELSEPTVGSRDLYFDTEFSQSTLGQFKTCLWKQWWAYWRNPDYNLVRFFFVLLTAFLLGSIYWRIGHKLDNSGDLRYVMGAMYAAVVYIGIINCSTVQPVVSVERTVYYREKAAGMYSAMPFAIAQVVIEIPYVFAQALCFSLIVYSMMSFQWTAAKYLWFFFISFSTFLYYTYYGMMTVSVSPNHEIAAILSSTVYAILVLFSGFFIPKPRIPGWWVWYSWICPLFWTIYGAITSQFGDLEKMIDVPGTTTRQSIKSYIEEQYDYHHDFLTVVAVALVIFPIVFALLYAFCIKELNFQRR